jgi:microsomal epoxide hydrolase
VEKFKEWTDSAQAPEDRDQMLTNVMLYWLTNTAASSARLYFETLKSSGRPPEVTVPVGIAVFPRDLAQPVRSLAGKTNNIVHWSEFGHGGHFAATEEPICSSAMCESSSHSFDSPSFTRRVRPCPGMC